MTFITLGEYLKEKRIAAGLSQKDIAKALGWSTIQLVSNNERNVSHPPFKSVKKLAKLLKVDSREIYLMMYQDAVVKLNKKYKGLI
jgi:transcriptional regulator with XRE-family HTH domain